MPKGGATMGKELSMELLELGFFSALGTVEHFGGGGAAYVKCDKHHTYDSNNGILVVYDEKGCPWVIKQSSFVHPAMLELYGCMRGAHVPHSNDGGYFINEVLPRLM